MRPKAEWAIDSDAMRATGIMIIPNIITKTIIVLVNPTSWSKIWRQNNFSWQNVIQPPLFWFSKLALFATSGL